MVMFDKFEIYLLSSVEAKSKLSRPTYGEVKKKWMSLKIFNPGKARLWNTAKSAWTGMENLGIEIVRHFKYRKAWL
ncbi:MAG: hypothetical protein WCW68_14550 [Methanothrix sp.]